MAVDIKHIEEEFNQLIKETDELRKKHPLHTQLMYIGTQLKMIRPYIEEIKKSDFRFVIKLEKQLMALEGLTKNFEKNSVEKGLYNNMLGRIDTLRKQIDALRKELKL